MGIMKYNNLLSQIEVINDELSEELKKSREYVESKVQHISNMRERNRYHLMPEVGWMNDPNGFSMFNEEYHLFYQYYPYDVKWGPMHWGHAKSKDLVKWEYLPVAMAPDQEYDDGGCFSGSAIEVEGKHLLMYTGHVNRTPEDPSKIRQVQCLAIGDGVSYKKIKNNPVITGDDLPEESNVCDFRDPKIWVKDNVYYTVVGSRDEDGSGKILLYKSENLLKWRYVGVLDYSRNELGRMWECPDLFQLDGRDVLLMSPQEMHKDEFRYMNGNTTVYFVGSFDYETARFERDNFDEIDYGLDFYAPQTTVAQDGRRIMTAWMQSWDRNISTDKFGWVGSMTLPRELKIVGDKLYQLPIREIENYRGEKVEYNNLEVDGSKVLPKVNGRHIEVKVEVKFKEAKRFSMEVMKNKDGYTLIEYDLEKKLLRFDRRNSNSGIEGLNYREVPLDISDNNLNLRIFLDTYSVEIFAENGQRTMTSTVYSDLDSDGIQFISDGILNLNVEKWDLKF